LLAEGGPLAQWLQATDLAVANGWGVNQLKGNKLLQAQLRLLPDKLPDSQPDKMELIRKALQDEAQGVMAWSSGHAMLEAVAI